MSAKPREPMDKPSNPLCNSCGKPQTDYAKHQHENHINNPLFNDDPPHWWLCERCDRDQINNIAGTPPPYEEEFPERLGPAWQTSQE